MRLKLPSNKVELKTIVLKRIELKIYLKYLKIISGVNLVIKKIKEFV